MTTKYKKMLTAATFVEYVDGMLRELEDGFDLRCRERVLELTEEIKKVISDERNEVDG